MVEITQLQKEFVMKDSLFITEFKKKTTELKVPSEMIPKSMRSWLDKALIKIPYNSLFNCNQRELDTYKELCTLEIEKMEWGVIQKAVSIIIGLSPDSFVDEDIKKIYTCIHKKADTLKYCPTCEGKGILLPCSVPKGDKLTLLISTEVIYKCTAINNFIFSSVNEIKESILVDIWENKYTQKQRFDANQIIAKTNGKQPFTL